MIAKACPDYSLTKPSTLVAISGSGNVSQFTALKVLELGATVMSLSDSKGSLIATSEAGFSKEVVESIGQLKLKGGSLESFKSFTDEGKYTYHAGTYCSASPDHRLLFNGTRVFTYLGQRPWTLLSKVHIALPGATQNEVSAAEAEALVKAGVRIVAEGSNMVR